MELGADGILLNTAISAAKDPIKMAEAMKLELMRVDFHTKLDEYQ